MLITMPRAIMVNMVPKAAVDSSKKLSGITSFYLTKITKRNVTSTFIFNKYSLLSILRLNELVYQLLDMHAL